MQLWDLLWFEWQFFFSLCFAVVSVVLFLFIHYSVFVLFAMKISSGMRNSETIREKEIIEKKKKDTSMRGREGEIGWKKAMQTDTHNMHCPRSIIFLENNIEIKTLFHHFFRFCARLNSILVKFFR